MYVIYSLLIKESLRQGVEFLKMENINYKKISVYLSYQQ